MYQYLPGSMLRKPGSLMLRGPVKRGITVRKAQRRAQCIVALLEHTGKFLARGMPRLSLSSVPANFNALGQTRWPASLWKRIALSVVKRFVKAFCHLHPEMPVIMVFRRYQKGARSQEECDQCPQGMSCGTCKAQPSKALETTHTDGCASS